MLRVVGWTSLNMWLVYHLLAIVIAPLSVPPTSTIYQTAWIPVGPYLSVLYLNHGYHYFAPEPGDATLLGYTLEFADGRSESGRLPNRGIEPRLLYHRHFMLTEQMQVFNDDIDAQLQEKWCRTYALALGRKYGAAKVTLSKVRHRVPTMERVRGGGKLDDSDLYTEEPLGTWECASR